MATAQGKGRRHPVNPERKCLWLMTAGMSFWLSILPAIILAEMFNLDAFIGIGQIAVLLFVAGCVFFSFGLVGRQELAEQRRHQNNEDNK
jgi:hypothetical protein